MNQQGATFFFGIETVFKLRQVEVDFEIEIDCQTLRGTMNQQGATFFFGIETVFKLRQFEVDFEIEIERQTQRNYESNFGILLLKSDIVQIV